MAITWNEIQTYFTDYDASHMKQVQPQIDLRDYDSVKNNAVLIYPWVADGRMPPGDRRWTKAHPEWITNFKAWIEAGFPK